MFTLIAFAFLAGLVTVFSPCIWPILPVILSATAAGGRYRPLGIVTGIAIAFTLATLFFSLVIAVLPLSREMLRTFGVAIIVLFALTLIFPFFGRAFDRLTRGIAIFGNHFTHSSRDGFWGGLAVGAALGLVWSPCAGPLLATVATLVATEVLGSAGLILTLAFVTGITIPLFGLAWAGERLLARSRFLSPYTQVVRVVFGLIMLAAAWMIATDYDAVLQAKITGTYPVCGPLMNALESHPTFLEALKQWRESNH